MDCTFLDSLIWVLKEKQNSVPFCANPDMDLPVTYAGLLSLVQEGKHHADLMHQDWE